MENKKKNELTLNQVVNEMEKFKDGFEVTTEKIQALSVVKDYCSDMLKSDDFSSKEVYESLRKEMDSNSDISDKYHKALEEAHKVNLKMMQSENISEEDKKKYFETDLKILQEMKDNKNETISNNRLISQDIIKQDEKNKKIKENLAKYFCISAVAIIGGVKMVTKYIDKK